MRFPPWTLALFAFGAASAGPEATAPPFALMGSDGAVHRLSDDAGRRVVVLAWFPKAFTGG